MKASGWKSKIALAGAALALSVLTVELLTRRYRPDVSPYWWPLKGCYREDPAVGYRMAPDKTCRYKGKEFDQTFHINSQGFRDKEYPIPTPPHTFRVLALGDSYTAALEVGIEKTFHKRLERFLNERSSIVRSEVIALGLGGSGPSIQQKVLEVYGLRYRPDVTLLATHLGNDVNDSCWDYANRPASAGAKSALLPYYAFENERLRLVWGATSTRSGQDPGPFFVHPHRFFYSYYLVLRTLKGIPAGRQLLARIHPGALAADELPSADEGASIAGPWENAYFTGNLDAADRDRPRCWKALVEGIHEMKRLIEINGSRFVVMLIPFRQQFSEEEFSEMVARIAPQAGMFPPGQHPDPDSVDLLFSAALTEKGIDTIALAPLMRERVPDPAVLYFKSDPHFTPVGHDVVAHILHDYFVVRDWLHG